MKKLTVFYLPGCPYCARARRAVESLRAENPAYAAVEVDWRDESRPDSGAERYDYYYVPSIFLGETKLYEAMPGDSEAEIRQHVEQALAAAGR